MRGGERVKESAVDGVGEGDLFRNLQVFGKSDKGGDFETGKCKNAVEGGDAAKEVGDDVRQAGGGGKRAEYRQQRVVYVA
ncbi:MAG: hypothetical protein MZV64_17355 [Ignavibacteriales bacterium]|nr:hypothetical protein [Ignavibacteriales bacterium]